MRNPNKSQGKVRDLNSSSREGNSYDQNNISALKNSLQKRKSENSRPNTRAFDEDSESFRRGRGDGPSRRSLLQTSKSTRYQIFGLKLIGVSVCPMQSEKLN